MYNKVQILNFRQRMFKAITNIPIKIKQRSSNRETMNFYKIFQCNTLYYTDVACATLSPGALNFIKRTPWVARPRMLTDLSGKRITCPYSDIIITSSSTAFELIINATTISPVLAVILAVLMPDPPRPWIL